MVAAVQEWREIDVTDLFMNLLFALVIAMAQKRLQLALLILFARLAADDIVLLSPC